MKNVYYYTLRHLELIRRMNKNFRFFVYHILIFSQFYKFVFFLFSHFQLIYFIKMIIKKRDKQIVSKFVHYS
jgi:hypothetical protein